MFRLVIQKLMSNSWKVLSLLLGSILVVGMICSIPIYSNAILQRMLTKDLEQSQERSGRYPGYIAVSSNYNYISPDHSEQMIDYINQESRRIFNSMPVEPDITGYSLMVSNLYHIIPEEPNERRRGVGIGSQTQLHEHVNIVRGRLNEPGISDDGVVEVIVSANALEYAEMMLDREYELYSYRQSQDDKEVLFTVRVTGVYEAADLQDTYWYQSVNAFRQTLMMDEQTLRHLTAENESMIWADHVAFAAYDYYQFRIQDVGQLVDTHRSGQALADEQSRTTRFTTTFYSVVESFIQREAQLRLTLQILIVPILLMLVFYIFMVSQLMVRSETHVISVLESRGAGRGQTLLLYGLESLILGIITFIIGPFLGLYMVRIIGAADGFLEFVSRTALPAAIDRQALFYGFIAVLLFMLTTQLPVFIQARTSIVEQKQKKSRLGKAPLWQRTFLDVILAAVSLYALFQMRNQLAIQQRTGTTGTDFNLDFLLFLASTFFILGFGLFFLRLYPLLLKLVYWIGRKRWPPVMFASFHQIGRSNGQEQFLMIFLILALSIGLFNANAARTINSNTEDTIRGQTGADLKIEEFWQPYNQQGMPIVEGGMGGPAQSSSSDEVVRYNEPDFSKFTKLDGIEHAARVYRSDSTRINQSGARSNAIELMAIDPYDFAQTAWFRSDTLPYHINEYMNIMMSMPNGVILSANLRDELDLRVGDAVIYTVNNRDNADGVIIGFVDFWPGFQPQVLDRDGNLVSKSLLVARFDHVLTNTAMQPYEVWLQRTDGATDAEIYTSIEENRVNVVKIESANQAIITAKNDPQLQGTNGALTLGFIVSMLVCAIGFLIYWIMSVQSRVLQFGIFRAMGMSKTSVIGMLAAEQGLVSGVAILFGVILGNLASYFYVPLFQLVYSSVDQPLPFRIISDPSDAQKVYLVLGILLLVCMVFLIRLILKIKIDQAVKLGED